MVVGINTLRMTDMMTHMRNTPSTIVTMPKIPIAIEVDYFLCYSLHQGTTSNDLCFDY